MKNNYTISEDGTYAIVELTQGQVTLVDIEDLDKIGEYRWYAVWNSTALAYYCNTAVRIAPKKQAILGIHRIIMDCPDGLVVDHIDGNSMNNRKYNLRIFTKAQNNMNKRIRKCNRSGHRNVVLKGDRYEVYVNENGKRHYIGSTRDYNIAVEMQESAAKELQGEYYRADPSVIMNKQDSIKKQIREPILFELEGYGEVYKIPLTQGQFALIDICDIDLVKEHSWYAAWNTRTNSYYAVAKIPNSEGKRVSIPMHRYIMNPPKEILVDHINIISYDNRRSNLRLATFSENIRNRLLSSSNSSGFKGVYWHTQSKRWRAQITVDGNRIYLGSFLTPEEAHEAYCAAALKYHKEFANFG